MSPVLFVLVLFTAAIGLFCTMALLVLCLAALKRDSGHLDEEEARRAVAPVAPNVQRRLR